MEENKVLKKLKKFIQKERWEYDFPITKETSIQKDLGIYGDDAYDFLLAFGKEFNVDVSNFLAADYFDDEGRIRIPLFINHFLGLKESKKILNVGHLEKAVIAGRLDEEVINS